jgi:predicted esterase
MSSHDNSSGPHRCPRNTAQRAPWIGAEPESAPPAWSPDLSGATPTHVGMIFARLAFVALVTLGACSKPPPEDRADAAAPPASAAASPSAAVSGSPSASAAPAASSDPIRIEAVEVPGDLRALVLRGAPREHRFAMVYLHGMCVYPGYYVESFMNAAAARGDLIAVQGDVSCGGDNFLHTWSSDLAALDRRIDAAFAAAHIAPPSDIVLIGYSQGADRAEALAARHPTKYRAVVLIASSSPPSPARLRGMRAAVMMAGTRDSQANMREGLVALQRARIPTTFIPMPDAWHGHMGSEPELTMARALDFVENAR